MTLSNANPIKGEEKKIGCHRIYNCKDTSWKDSVKPRPLLHNLDMAVDASEFEVSQCVVLQSIPPLLPCFSTFDPLILSATSPCSFSLMTVHCQFIRTAIITNYSLTTPTQYPLHHHLYTHIHAQIPMFRMDGPNISRLWGGHMFCVVAVKLLVEGRKPQRSVKTNYFVLHVAEKQISLRRLNASKI